MVMRLLAGAPRVGRNRRFGVARECHAGAFRLAHTRVRRAAKRAYTLIVDQDTIYSGENSTSDY